MAASWQANLQRSLQEAKDQQDAPGFRRGAGPQLPQPHGPMLPEVVKEVAQGRVQVGEGEPPGQVSFCMSHSCQSSFASHATSLEAICQEVQD